MLSALALTALLGADVHVAVELKSPLRLDAGGVLRGVILVRVENRGADSVELEHTDVHGFRLVPEAGGPDALIIHTCDCGFALGLETPPEGRRFRGSGSSRCGLRPRALRPSAEAAAAASH